MLALKVAPSIATRRSAMLPKRCCSRSITLARCARFTDATAVKNPDESVKRRASCSIAARSFGRHDPPKPRPARR